MRIQLKRSQGHVVGIKDQYHLEKTTFSLVNPASTHARVIMKTGGSAMSVVGWPERAAYMEMSIHEAQVLANNLAIMVEQARAARKKKSAEDLI